MYNIWCLRCNKWFDLNDLTKGKMPIDICAAIPVFTNLSEIKLAIAQAKDNNITHSSVMRVVNMGHSRLRIEIEEDPELW